LRTGPDTQQADKQELECFLRGPYSQFT
jgi:hypothetical protein